MPNTYFQFKQFIIHQDKCAMKVTTDACLFGAWAAQSIKERAVAPESCIDIGTGTGLLSLMIVQKNEVNIDAIEIDEPATKQALQNFQLSIWKENLSVLNQSAQQFAQRSRKKYDIIVSNPPFFDGDLKSGDQKRNLALHSTELSLEELFACADRLMHRHGSFFLLIPFHRKDEALLKAAMFNFYLVKEMNVKQTTQHDHFRTFLWLSREPNGVTDHCEVVIKNGDEYTENFIYLLKDYYLYL